MNLTLICKNWNSGRIAFASIVLCGLNLASGSALRAQQMADLPSNPADSIQKPKDSPQTSSSTDASVIPAETLTFHDRVKIYEQSLISPATLLGPLADAGIDQARNSPQEWGQGAAGFGRRFGSELGVAVICRTITFGVAAADGEDPRYFPSGESGVWRRTRHAVVWTFISHTSRGGSMPAISRFSGAYGSAFIANSWEPRSLDTTGDALVRGSLTLLASAGWHVFDEFWPDIRSAIHHKN